MALSSQNVPSRLSGKSFKRDFLDLSECSPSVLRGLVDDARRRKSLRPHAGQACVDADHPLRGKVFAMIFEKPSTRTRVSFDVALRQLGAEALILSSSDLQMGRGETIADTARVLSRYVDGIIVRTWGHDRLNEMASWATVPVINALTDFSHPCQILADILTFEERVGPIAGKVITWCGDVCNVTHSWIHAALAFDFELRVAHPPSLPLSADVLAWALDRGVRLVLEPDPKKAASGAHGLVTDTWFSMNEARSDSKIQSLLPYQVNADMMGLARPEAIFMHCLPCHRGEEVTSDVIDGPSSVVFEEAENRVHAQKAILAWCFQGATEEGQGG